MLRCVLKAAKYEKQNPYLVYCCFESSDDIFVTKTLNLSDVSSFSPVRVQLAVANNKDRVYFEHQILALLLVYQTPRSNVEFHMKRTKLRFDTGKATPLGETSYLIRI